MADTVKRTPSAKKPAAKPVAQTTKANNKTSAQNKLKALGLTDAEIEAL